MTIFTKLENQLRNIELDIFVLVHYFGGVKAQKESRVFSDQKNAILLEDCAHVVSYKDNRWLGDYLLFCPHKHFISPSIGVLIGKISVTHGAKTKARQAVFPLIWVLKQLIRPILKRRVSLWGGVWSDGVENFDNKLPNKHLINKSISYLENCSDTVIARKNNTALLLERLESVGGWRQFNAQSVSETPYVLAMICDNEEIAKSRYKNMNGQHSLVMQWPDLAVEICQNKDVTSQTMFWLDRVLFFFIHQR